MLGRSKKALGDLDDSLDADSFDYDSLGDDLGFSTNSTGILGVDTPIGSSVSSNDTSFWSSFGLAVDNELSPSVLSSTVSTPTTSSTAFNFSSLIPGIASTAENIATNLTRPTSYLIPQSSLTNSSSLLPYGNNLTGSSSSLLPILLLLAVVAVIYEERPTNVAKSSSAVKS